MLHYEASVDVSIRRVTADFSYQVTEEDRQLIKRKHAHYTKASVEVKKHFQVDARWRTIDAEMSVEKISKITTVSVEDLDRY